MADKHRTLMTAEMQRYFTSVAYGATEVTIVIKEACTVWQVAHILTGDGTRWRTIIDNVTSAVFPADVSLAPSATVKFPVTNML